jgi:hypothetical protein
VRIAIECLDVSFSWPSVFLARCVIPLFIYELFSLWVIWVSKFSLYAKILLSHKVRVTIGFCIGSIVLVVRAFEDELFYDPFEFSKVILMFCHYRLMIRFIDWTVVSL